MSRQYPRSLVKSALDNSRAIPRDTALKKAPRVEFKRVVLTVPFNQTLPSITKLVKHRHRCLLERDLDAREYLQEAPMVAYLRPKNLREWLVRAVVPAPPRRMV